MEKNWIVKPQGDPTIIRRLSKELNINEILASLLVQRGISTFEEARLFFRPQLDQLHDPFLMKDMEKAVTRIESAIENEEKILVYGDYDVDGTTAVALVYTWLRQFVESLDFYIPDRYSEGYGISYQSIDYAAKNGFTLIIALDCGIKAVEKIAYASSIGVDFIICDHHRPGDELPNAVAVLDPKRPDCSYPFDELSGCGVGFKLIQALSSKKGLPFDSLTEYLDLVVVSIASDIVPITGENRILAYFGLQLINSKPRPGFEALVLVTGVSRTPAGPYYFNKELTVSDLVFGVGPRINAAGRIETGRNSVDLLVTRSLEEAHIMADQINNCNNERRSLDSQTTQEALDSIINDPALKDNLTTVLYRPDWHKGVIGIVASRLTEVFYRPTIIFCKSNGMITGSARSIKDFDIYDAVDHCSGLLEHFGGHKYAAGLSLKPENLEEFRDRFEAYARDVFKAGAPVPEIEIDAILTLGDINPKFYTILKQFAPFGPGNMAPIFLTERVMDTGYSRIVGKNHIKLSVVHPHISGFPISGIAFQLGDSFSDIHKGTPFNICYQIEENDWNGKTTLQLNVKDMKMGAL
ncbi:MAG TPA: single-stranded-DNA-specific exonuclease RecJ [Bacteroidales bacterium]|nr:MAG: single-stranded-DNA-specific exonuclease RecJ [Bacteroidetes bacterium GWE2_42_24]OFY27575.1 MAG: single-stranded-DNA-specific exonuclease RecJ [Bacteroidetes bacterium GWF2_43_11]HBZ66099.1 single-stranded-DNA-specific exonuclease RecJ [Bacteroidales bacterium]